jgi:hypothetical protein
VVEVEREGRGKEGGGEERVSNEGNQESRFRWRRWCVVGIWWKLECEGGEREER